RAHEAAHGAVVVERDRGRLRVDRRRDAPDRLAHRAAVSPAEEERLVVVDADAVRERLRRVGREARLPVAVGVAAFDLAEARALARAHARRETRAAVADAAAPAEVDEIFRAD